MVRFRLRINHIECLCIRDVEASGEDSLRHKCCFTVDYLALDCISMLENVEMERDTLEDEVWAAVFSFKNDKFPFPDYLPIEFYKVCWDLIHSESLKI